MTFGGLIKRISSLLNTETAGERLIDSSSWFKSMRESNSAFNICFIYIIQKLYANCDEKQVLVVSQSISIMVSDHFDY